MSKLLLKTTLTSSVLLLSMGYSEMASAHCFNGATLSAQARAADLYALKCFNDGVNGNANRLRVQPNPTASSTASQGITVTLARAGFSPVSGSDTSVGTAFSDLANCTGASSLGAAVTLTPSAQSGAPVGTNGNGNYNILVQKSSTTSDTGTKTYGLLFHCENSAGVETGTAEIVSNAIPPELSSVAGGDADSLINQ